MSVVAPAPQVTMKDLAQGLSMDDQAIEAEKAANEASVATASLNDAQPYTSDANEQKNRVSSDSNAQNTLVTNLGNAEGEALTESPEIAQLLTASDEIGAAAFPASNDPSRRTEMEDHMQARDTLHTEQMDELAEKKRQELQGLVDHSTGPDLLAVQDQHQAGKADDTIGDGVPSVEASMLGGSVEAPDSEMPVEAEATGQSELEDAISKTFVVADLSKGQRIKAQ